MTKLICFLITYFLIILFVDDFQNSEMTLNYITFFVHEGTVKEFTEINKQDIKEEVEIGTNSELMTILGVVRSSYS